ncbi:hypothetical protein [Streptomyces sp. NPDC102462]|uniref:hypothetical protein n=1 Tax=Streptomyces sp. NPDC102462 TaxID=3366178 RepID=UPI00381F9359
MCLGTARYAQRTQTIDQLRSLMVTAPSAVRDKLRGLPTRELMESLARSRPTGDAADPGRTTRITLRRPARR